MGQPVHHCNQESKLNAGQSAKLPELLCMCALHHEASSALPCAVLQGKATTREWDLNRPDAKKTDKPARVGDVDPRCGPSSLQKFDGEDLTVSN